MNAQPYASRHRKLPEPAVDWVGAALVVGWLVVSVVVLGLLAITAVQAVALRNL